MISRAVELNSDTWLVTSVGSRHRITAMRKNWLVITCYGGQPGSADGQLNGPMSLSVDKTTGNMVFLDYHNQRVLLMNSSLSAARVFPLPVNAGSLASSHALFVEYSLGRLYGGHNRILVFDNATNIDAII